MTWWVHGNLDASKTKSHKSDLSFLFVQRNRMRKSFRTFTVTYISHPTVILQPLRHVDRLDVSRLLEWPHIQDELMGDETCSGKRIKCDVLELDISTLILAISKIIRLKAWRFESYTFPASEEDFIVTLQPLGHVVGVEDGHLSGMQQASGSHHLNTEHRGHWLFAGLFHDHKRFNVPLLLVIECIQ